jgi:hypothetical protein
VGGKSVDGINGDRATSESNKVYTAKLSVSGGREGTRGRKERVKSDHLRTAPLVQCTHELQ